MQKTRANYPRLDLVVVAGPDEGVRIPLDPPNPTPIGRSSKGLQLADPLASIHHAEIRWTDQGGVVLVDLGSATGTRLGGKALEKDAPVTLRPGDVIEIGESSVRLDRRVRRLALGLIVAILIGLAMIAGIQAARTLNPTSASDQRLTWHQPVRQGLVAAPRLRLDETFARQRGLDAARVTIRRVTDFDGNGIDEIWLTERARELVFTFGKDGSWVPLGELPEGCVDGDASMEGSGISRGFPQLRCPGVQYQLLDGRYEPIRQEGLVVWVLQPADPEVEGSTPTVAPVRVNLRRTERLAGFLGARGVSEPVTYLLCEGAHPEIRAQVKTVRGAQVPLRFGCHSDLTIQGRPLGSVLAIATSATARQVLLDDLGRFFAGNADGLFLDDALRDRLAAWQAEPGFLLGGVRLEVEGGEQFFSPLAPEGPVPIGDPPLPTTGQQAAPAALTATLLTSGKARLDPPGCAVLEVSTGAWTCALSAGCVSGSTFLTVREVGCGEPREVLTASYRGGVTEGTADGLTVRAVVEVDERAERVLRARVTYRKGTRSSP